MAATLERDEDVLGDIEGATPNEWAQSWAQGLEAQRLWTMLGLEFRLYGLRNPPLPGSHATGTALRTFGFVKK